MNTLENRKQLEECTEGQVLRPHLKSGSNRIRSTCKPIKKRTLPCPSCRVAFAKRPRVPPSKAPLASPRYQRQCSWASRGAYPWQKQGHSFEKQKRQRETKELWPNTGPPALPERYAYQRDRPKRGRDSILDVYLPRQFQRNFQIFSNFFFLLERAPRKNRDCSAEKETQKSERREE